MALELRFVNVSASCKHDTKKPLHCRLEKGNLPLLKLGDNCIQFVCFFKKYKIGLTVKEILFNGYTSASSNVFKNVNNFIMHERNSFNPWSAE